jgi:hypothetical protein
MPFNLPPWLTGDVRSILELMYFLSGPAVALAACLALKQLRLAKEQLAVAINALDHAKRDLQIRSRREAVQLAAERCEKFGEMMMTRRNAHMDKIQADGIELKIWVLTNDAFERASLKDRSAAEQWVAQLRAKPDALISATAVLNELEAFAIYFARGAADEETAYPVVGALFCTEVQIFAPYLIDLRHKDVPGLTSGPFQNSIDLFNLWHLRMRQKELEAEANKLSLEVSGRKPSTIKPIGTE